ncbi:MAG: riboflavin biosynthesis protein RibD [Sulfurimonas sp.]|nr:MAG: riboflavin biosynthesis protein RibD [Sulfurimonas sp.]
MVVDTNFYMNLALTEAWKYQGLTYPNPAVGCVILGQDNVLLAIEAHKKAGEAHAEVLALQVAYASLSENKEILNLSKSSDIHNYLLQNHNNIFNNISLFTTLEPCSHLGRTPSCALLISQMGIKKVYVGSLDTNKVALGGNKILEQNNIFVQNSILKKECDDLVFPFKSWQKKNFVFFKWAQRLNGTTDGGAISSSETRVLTHSMRDVCDLLVIGGNTVRIDRPTLDARDVKGKAPDILIYSKQKNFDKSIALFNVKNRKVIISHTLDEISNYKNIMIEGSSKMFALTLDITDYYLSYISPSFGGDKGFSKIDEKFQILNVQKEEKDIIMWIKRDI